MIESVKIENFRCFSELEVHGLKPINIIVGENASGKTVFLESLYLAMSGMPADAFQLREWRQLTLPAQRDSIEIWDDLFHQYDSSRPITISLQGSQTLQIRRGPGGIEFHWKPGNEEIVSTLENQQEHSWLAAAYHTASQVESLGPHSLNNPQWLAARFSSLDKEGETRPVLSALQSEFPFLKDLSLALDGGNPAVFASLEGSKRKLPAALVSDGFNKLLGILLSIASASKGTLLIDQIEDGFYFKKLPSIWKIIHQFALEKGTQIFATTHSQECLSALLPVLEAHEDDFALLRASRSEGVSKLTVIDGKGFSSMLSQEFEVR
jgi:hypothetical protein